MATRYLDELKHRLARTTNLKDICNITDRIAEVEERLRELPQNLSIEVRDEIAMWEGQLRFHANGMGSERNADAIRARIAALKATAELVREAA